MCRAFAIASDGEKQAYVMQCFSSCKRFMMPARQRLRMHLSLPQNTEFKLILGLSKKSLFFVV